MKKEIKVYGFITGPDKGFHINIIFPSWMKFLMRFCSIFLIEPFKGIHKLDLHYKNDGSFREKIDLR